MADNNPQMLRFDPNRVPPPRQDLPGQCPGDERSDILPRPVEAVSRQEQDENPETAESDNEDQGGKSRSAAEIMSLPIMVEAMRQFTRHINPPSSSHEVQATYRKEISAPNPGLKRRILNPVAIPRWYDEQEVETTLVSIPIAVWRGLCTSYQKTGQYSYPKNARAHIVERIFQTHDAPRSLPGWLEVRASHNDAETLKKVTGKYLEQRRGVQTQVETPTRTLKEKRLMAVTEATRNTPGLNSPAFSGLSDSDIYRMATYTDRGLKLMTNGLGLANKVDKARRSQYKRGYWETEAPHFQNNRTNAMISSPATPRRHPDEQASDGENSNRRSFNAPLQTGGQTSNFNRRSVNPPSQTGGQTVTGNDSNFNKEPILAVTPTLQADEQKDGGEDEGANSSIIQADSTIRRSTWMDVDSDSD